MSRTFEENLVQYAKLAVHGGVGLKKGQELVITAGIENAHFVRLITAEAYAAGATCVTTLFSDDLAAVIRYEKGSEEAIQYAPEWLYNGIRDAYAGGAARLGVTSFDPYLFKNVNPDLVAASGKAQGAAAKAMMKYISEFQINWSIVGAPSPAWAKTVFPGCSESEAVERLWQAIFSVSRVLHDDPLAVWSQHCDHLDRRREWLNSLHLTDVRFNGPGTDFTVGLAEGAIWCGGWGQAKNGVKCGPNIPTEEVFTMPHRARVNGVVSSTKPLSLRGQVVDGIKVEFKDGAAVSASASQGEETFRKLLEADGGAVRLGELALVPNSCEVSQSNVLFFNTLYDENAASHIAMGQCYAENMAGYADLSDEERSKRGANESIIHVDWMIGSGEVDVTGITASGDSIPLMKSGEWTESV